MPAITLTPAQRKEKRSEAHHLDPVVLIGAEGLSQAVLKVRVFSDDRQAREDMLAQLSDQLGAAPIQHIGKLLVLWRPIPPKEKTPDEQRKAGPKVVKVLKYSKRGGQRPEVRKLTVLGNERLTKGGMVKRAKERVTSRKKRALES
jgi:RNA-binding protein